ncbi:lachrymatory-factor synthase-like [Melia azedarach]|uniref:Lachrymatory-factor synthase-like n=1 Tax=Melia azedarach TaxID=155640 RepID=A0ACC1XBH4_MELAZ|nr:lachrymatory-factor synthase-like [Melia azedarach]
MAQAQARAKWEGKSSVEVAGLTADQVWPCLEDFGNLHKWHPSVDTCYLEEGVPGKVGQVRYCGLTTKSSDGSDEISVQWSKGKLIILDPTERCLSYQVTENNVGIDYYVATIKVLPINDDGKTGSIIEWAYVADPFVGSTHDDLVYYLNYTLQSMAKKMQQELLKTT